MSRRREQSLPLFPTEAISEQKQFTLRPYQERAIRLLRMHVDAGKRRILCVAPARSGKTAMMAAITKSSTLPVLALAHRVELIDQLANELLHVGLTNIGVIRGDDARTNPSASIQVASIATLTHRTKPFLGQKIIIFCDEAHRSISDSWLDILAMYPDAIVIGFTATPSRLDGRPMGEFYEVLEVVVTYQELLKRRDWLTMPLAYGIPLLADLSHLRTVGGDYDDAQVAEIMGRLEGDIVGHWFRLSGRHPAFTSRGELIPGKTIDGPRRSTFLYACTVAHSLSLCTRFEKEGARIVHIDAKTPEEQRRAALKDLAAGRIEIVSNVNVFMEGTNVPSVKCVSHCRPTQSTVLWRQSAPRCMTPHGNITPLIIDHGGNWDRLGPPHEDLSWSLTSKAQRRTGASAPMKICKACFAYVAIGCILCPHCGSEFSASEMKLPTETGDGAPRARDRHFFDEGRVLLQDGRRCTRACL